MNTVTSTLAQYSRQEELLLRVLEFWLQSAYPRGFASRKKHSILRKASQLQPRLLGFSLRKWNRREKTAGCKNNISRNICARHVTSRCQCLFPLLPFWKGKALETRLSQLLCQILPCPSDCAAYIRYFDSLFTVSKCLARCACCHNRHWKLHYSSTCNFTVTHSSPVLLRQIAQGTPSVWSMFPWQHLPA